MNLEYRYIPKEEKSRLKLQLKHLWKECFFDTDEGTDFVFDNIYPGVRAFVCMEDEICCAALYLIDGKIPDISGVLRNAHYLFGAGTLTKYRGKGIMSGLIEYALNESVKYGDKASVLLPANKGLYDYYGKIGYSPLFGTKVREFDLLKADKNDLSGNAGLSDIEAEIFNEDKNDRKYKKDKEGKKEITSLPEEEKFINIMKLRKTAKLPVGVMQFSGRTVKNALVYNGIYGGITLCGEDFYITVQGGFRESGEAVASEFISEKDAEEVLKGGIFGLENIGKISVRIPDHSDREFGMMKVLDKEMNFSPMLYIGLTKD